MPHALLFAGPKGVGKREMADGLAARLLCETPRVPHQPACGHCDSCLMIAGGSHPDFRLLQPEAADEEGETSPEGEKKKASKQIRIGQIRELEAFFNIGSHRGGARVCLIEPAEAMNAVTANSLLKILEEPSVSFYFIMISHRWRSLLPTLLSRSRRIMFSPPAEAEAQAWLSSRKLAAAAEWLPFFANAPLALAEAAESGRLKKLETIVADLLKPQDPLAHAARWEGYVKAEGGLAMEELVLILQKWLHDLSRAAAGQTPRYFPHQNRALSVIAQRAAPPALLQAERQVMQLRAWSNHPLNPRLFLEDLCVRALRPLAS
ncbi:MAG: DNA polymerase III subunit delta' [Rhodocyclaceae bacterium]|nr:DNA polymerase III subunit delta' [Rhodocyclaceae bacterium]